MRVRAVRRWLAGASGLVLTTSVLTLVPGPVQAAGPATPMHLDCAKGLALCTEVQDSEAVFGEDIYVGHDEPATLSYDSHAGAGNNNTYLLRLPKDPPKPPKVDPASFPKAAPAIPNKP